MDWSLEVLESLWKWFGTLFSKEFFPKLESFKGLVNEKVIGHQSL
ncbi:hypothetical protein OE09_1187 [Flavobacteriaceae bacterium MAR_2010_72]|nr:hypothetical protein OE09_1187 [Flavobacteriaceae bacterium MAR_2010_72]